MFKRYQAKHYNRIIKKKCISKMVLSSILLVLFALNYLGSTVCYFSAKSSLVNVCTIAGQYTVHFDENGGTGTMPDQKIFCTSQTNLTPNTFINPGYIFSRWNTSNDGTGEDYSDGASVVDLAVANSTITLYAQWEEEKDVAEIDGVRYKSLAAAVYAVKANNVQKTIKLLRNVDLTSAVTVPANKNIIFDLQSFTVKNAAGANINIIENYGTIEIINGTIQSNALKGAIDNYATGNLTVSSGRIITTGERQAIYNSGGMLYITGDAYISTNATDRATINNNKPTNGSAGTITISGGTIVSLNTITKGAIENSATGTLNIIGGNIISNKYVGVDNYGTLVIGEQDGIVDTESPTIQGATYGVTSAKNLTLNFYDGIIKGKTDAFNNEDYISTWENGFTIWNSTEEIDGETYKIAYLETGKAKVHFDANGGTTNERLRYRESGEQLGELPTATRERYVLDGWYTSATGGIQIDASQIITENVTYYAHWIQTEAIVTFDPTGGTVDESEKLINCGTEIGTLPTANKQYKVFAGWYTEATGGEEISSNTIINEDITYYAHWDPQYITVTLDPNEGTISTPTVEVIATEPIGTLPIPTRTDYDFIGWYTDPVDGTKINENEVITEATTYYAHWKSKYAAKIGEQKYISLQKAVDAAPTNNTETVIQLLRDTKEAINVIEGKNIVLDLNNNTLSNDGTYSVGSENLAMRNRGTVKVINGTITGNTRSATINNEVGGRLIIENANIIQTGTGNGKNKQAIYNNGGTLEISGTSYICAKNSGAYGGSNRGAIQNLCNGSSIGIAIITGGTIESLTSYGIVNQPSAKLTIGTKDGSIDSTTPVIIGNNYGIQNEGELYLYDGTTKGKTGSIDEDLGTITDIETDATRVDTTETTGGINYHVTYYE